MARRYESSGGGMSWFKKKVDVLESYSPSRPLMWWIDDLSHEHCGLIDHPVRGWDKMPWPDNEKCYIAIDKSEYDKRVVEIESLQSQLKEALYDKEGMATSLIEQIRKTNSAEKELMEARELLQQFIPWVDFASHHAFSTVEQRRLIRESIERAKKAVGEK